MRENEDQNIADKIAIQALSDKLKSLKKDYDRQFWRYVELEKVHNRFVEQTLSRLTCEADIRYERTFKESEE